MKSKFWILFFLVIGIGSFIRFWDLGQHPPALNRDEVAIGYNAYSLLQTGRDEWGESWPLSFKSFGDYKMPGYIYATMIPVAIWGLTEFSVRFWSALAGSIALILIYFLTRWLFTQLNFSKRKVRTWSLVSVVILALNPWHIYFSRVGFEANLNLTLFLLGLTSFLYGLKRRRLLVVSALAFSAMLYTYSSSFIFLPFFGLTLLIMFGKQLFEKRDCWLSLAGVIFLILGSYALWSVWQVSAAKTNITIFSDPGILDSYHHLRAEMFAQSPLWARAWFNRPFFYFRLFLQNYLSSFSPRFLFISAGDHPWHQISGMGHFYWLDGLFMVLGLGTLVLKRNRASLFLLAWILLAPLPSAITIDAPHATRMLQLILALVVLISLGLQFIWQLSCKWAKPAQRLVLISLVFMYGFQVLRFGYLYIVQYPKNLPRPMLPGIDQAIDWVETQDSGRVVIFTNPLDFAYVYVAFYRPLDPVEVQKQADWKPPDLANLTAIEKVGRYRFWEGTPDIDQKAYYVLVPGIKSPGGFELKETIFAYGEPQWLIYAN